MVLPLLFTLADICVWSMLCVNLLVLLSCFLLVTEKTVEACLNIIFHFHCSFPMYMWQPEAGHTHCLDCSEWYSGKGGIME